MGGPGRGVAKGKGRMRQSPRKRGPSRASFRSGQPRRWPVWSGSRTGPLPRRMPCRERKWRCHPATQAQPLPAETRLFWPGDSSSWQCPFPCALCQLPSSSLAFQQRRRGKSGLRDGQEREKLPRPFTPLSRPNLPRPREALGGGGGLTWTPKAASAVQGPPPCPPPSPLFLSSGLVLFQLRVAKPARSPLGPDSRVPGGIWS